MHRRALLVLALSALGSFAAMGQNSLEIIALRHRTAEQVIPVLRPLLQPGATLSGQAGQLFVRASPANLAELKRVLEAIDRPARRLAISVRFDEARMESEREIGASGRIGARGSRIDIRAQDARGAAEERVDQRVQVLEGSRATIATGQSRPVRERQLIRTPAGVVSQELTVIQELTTGFQVIPRVAGDVVHLEIVQQSAADAASQGLTTSVSGRLGEWFELGAVSTAATREAGAIASANRSEASATRRVWVRVDELP